MRPHPLTEHHRLGVRLFEPLTQQRCDLVGLGCETNPSQPNSRLTGTSWQKIPGQTGATRWSKPGKRKPPIGKLSMACAQRLNRFEPFKMARWLYSVPERS